MGRALSRWHSAHTDPHTKRIVVLQTEQTNWRAVFDWPIRQNLPTRDKRMRYKFTEPHDMWKDTHRLVNSWLSYRIQIVWCQVITVKRFIWFNWIGSNWINNFFGRYFHDARSTQSTRWRLLLANAIQIWLRTESLFYLSYWWESRTYHSLFGNETDRLWIERWSKPQAPNVCTDRIISTISDNLNSVRFKLLCTKSSLL